MTRQGRLSSRREMQQEENAGKKAENVEKKLLKRMKSSGMNMNDITKLIANATKAVEKEKWKPPQD